jgi:hypothetical protein
VGAAGGAAVGEAIEPGLGATVSPAAGPEPGVGGLGLGAKKVIQRKMRRMLITRKAIKFLSCIA